MNNVDTDFLLSSNNGTNTLFDNNIYLQVCVYIGFCMNYAVVCSWYGFIHVYCCHYHFVFLWFITLWLLRSPQKGGAPAFSFLKEKSAKYQCFDMSYVM